MSEDARKPISRADALAKAAECRAMLPLTSTEPQRVMLKHIAETWERIAAAAPDS